MILQRMARTMEAGRLNAIANHPEVRPWTGGEGPMDFTAFAANPAHFCFIGEHCGFLCHPLDLGVYEVHSMAVPEGRGGATLTCVREALRYMFCATDCTELLTRCPDGNSAALGLARVSGFQEIFRRDGVWTTPAGVEGVSFQSMSLARWRQLDPEIASVGRKFHDQLHAAKAAAGSTAPDHPDDEAHDRAVGASALMILSANPVKGVWAYNRWASFAGYQPIRLLSEAPVMVDVVDAIVSAKDGAMEVLSCRLG